MCHCVSFWFKLSRKMAKILTVSRKSYHPIETFLVHSVVMWLSNVSSALIAPHKETLKSTWVFVEHNIRRPEIDRIHYRRFHYNYIQNVMAVKMYCMHFSQRYKTTFSPVYIVGGGMFPNTCPVYTEREDLIDCTILEKLYWTSEARNFALTMQCFE